VTLRRCRECGCTDRQACVHPGAELVCSWEGADLCSACAPDAIPGWEHPPRWVQRWPTPELLAVFDGVEA
jgi:hypothetical protein